jgi:Fe-S cluster biosynthesis and repair protein YggX
MQSTSSCAYCNKAATRTKEHLWPASLHKRLYAANQQKANAFWLARLQREIPSEPQVRDVCANCNNVVLSKLDSYICCLFDSTLVTILHRYERVYFEHSYHLLKRWLLKMCFNSARIHDSIDRIALEALRPYMLGQDDRLGRSVQLFVQLAFPESVPARELDPNSESDGFKLFEPTIHRVGHMLFRANGVDQKLVRTIHLRSYSFYLAYWPLGGTRAEQDDFEGVFTSYLAATKMLRPSEPVIQLHCNGIGAWTSYRDSRSGQFASDNDA